VRIVRIHHRDAPRFAVVEDGDAVVLSAAPWDGGARTPERVPLAAAHLLAPVAPSKIVCVGRNYRAHAEELGNEVPKEPLLFLKPPSALLAPGGTIELPPESERVEHEGELGVVIGTRLRDANEASALASVFGYTCVNDVTARDLQKRDVQFTRGKGFDTFCPVGPAIETELDPSALRLRVEVDGETRQDANTAQMIFSVAHLLSYISRIMTLEPGDLIATGTPSGVGPLADRARVSVEIEGIGTLSNLVAARRRP
jgi:2-keto-4-pentenoate hydratase/2-oxohepta-3-ene-1,7-dioic acid hydratase in catechol pathway